MEPIFTITFRKGLANRHRLPLNHVIETLQELERMIRDVGKHIQRQKGQDQQSGDFGLELVATRSGVAFKKGSVKAYAVITRNVEVGIQAVQAILGTVDVLDKKKPKSVSSDEIGDTILRRLVKVAELQREDKTELLLELKAGTARKSRAQFTERAAQTTEFLRDQRLIIEDVTVYGKLRELRDRTQTDIDGAHFWGELVGDGEVWRVQFNNGDLNTVLPMFRQQVVITGDATYFRASSPRLDARAISLEQQRDYVAAFDKYSGVDEKIYGDVPLETLLREMRE